MHTPDSSRYWIANTYEERFQNGLEPENVDKVCTVSHTLMYHVLFYSYGLIKELHFIRKLLTFKL